MSKEENKNLVSRMYEEIHNKGNLDTTDKFVTSDFVDHNPVDPRMPKGPEGIRQVFGMFHSAFPDFHATVEDMITEGDTVCNHHRMEAVVRIRV